MAFRQCISRVVLLVGKGYQLCLACAVHGEQQRYSIVTAPIFRFFLLLAVGLLLSNAHVRCCWLLQHILCLPACLPAGGHGIAAAWHTSVLQVPRTAVSRC
jgi:hypothetical protein